MKHNGQPISRRTLLKGVGAALGLPLLEAMLPRTAAAAEGAKAPVRMAFLYFPNGVNAPAWLPPGRGKAWELSETLQPLAKVKNEVLVFTELWNASANTGDGHYVKTGGWLTSTTISKTTGADVRSNGISMDQICAQKIGNLTPLPSLELGIEPITSGVDVNVGYTRLYGSHIAWSSPTTPLAKEINPQLAFDRLFRSDLKKTARNSAQDKSVLDLVAEDARSLRSKVGANDQRKLDEYLESVRAVEKRITFHEQRMASDYHEDPLARKEIEALGLRIKDFYKDPGKLRERGHNHTEQVRLMLDLMVLAFWTDSTRISTFMFANAVSNKNFSFLDGVKVAHHETSHHDNDKSKLEQFKKINIWHAQQYAYMLEKMQQIKEGDGTLLDNSMIMFGGGFRDGNSHNPHNLPLVMAGRGGGTIKPGRHLVFEKDSKLSNLYRAMLARMGTPVSEFADSTGEMKGLDDENFTGTAKI